MLESLDPDDSLRYAYYSRNLEFIGLARPLESCLTEDPIQVMLSGRIAAMREAEARLRAADFAGEFRLAVTSYEHKDFAMIDVIPAGCSKGSSLAEWAALRASHGKKFWPSVTTTTTWKCFRLPDSRSHGKQRAGVENLRLA